MTTSLEEDSAYAGSYMKIYFAFKILSLSFYLSVYCAKCERLAITGSRIIWISSPRMHNALKHQQPSIYSNSIASQKTVFDYFSLFMENTHMYLFLFGYIVNIGHTKVTV